MSPLILMDGGSFYFSTMLKKYKEEAYMKKIFTCLLIALLLVGCGSSNGGSEDKKYTVGITDGYQLKAWTYVKEQAAKDGITLEIREFDSYTLPNKALDTKDIDLNSFQHINYLESEIATNGYKIKDIAKTILEPMALYSEKYDALADLPDNAKVAIPDDVTNQGRALNLLAVSGLITLSTTEREIPKLSDIATNPKNLQFTQLLANNIPTVLNDVDLAAINGSIAQDAKLKLTDAVAQEAVSLNSDNPFINVIVVREEDVENKDILKLVDLYRSDAVKEIIEKETNGGTYPVW